MKERRQSSKVLEPEYLIPPLFDGDGVQVSSGIGRDGKEYPDPVPMSPPVGYEPPDQLEQMIDTLLRRREFLAAVERGDFETPEEADDFDVDEDYDPRFPETVYEAYFEAKAKRRAAQDAERKYASSATVSGVDGERQAQVTVTERSPRSAADDAKVVVPEKAKENGST